MTENTQQAVADTEDLGMDIDALDNLDIPDPDIEYQSQDDSGCEGGACKI